MGRGGGSHLHQGSAGRLHLEQCEEDMEGEHEKEKLEVGLWRGQSNEASLPICALSGAGTRAGLCGGRQHSAGSLLPQIWEHLFPRAELSIGLCTPAPPLI